MSYNHWMSEWYNETHDSDGEYTGKTAQSKMAFQFAEEAAANGYWETESEHSEPDYSEHSEPEYSEPEHSNYGLGDNDDYYDHNFMDPDQVLVGELLDEQFFMMENYDMNVIHEFVRFEKFLDNRYRKCTDIENLKLFYMELAESDARVWHSKLMNTVLFELKHFTPKIAHTAVDTKISSLVSNFVVSFSSNSKSESHVSKQFQVEKKKFDSDVETAVDENYDTSNFDDEETLKQTYKIVLNTPKTKSPETPTKCKTPRRNFRLCDFNRIRNHIMFC